MRKMITATLFATMMTSAVFAGKDGAPAWPEYGVEASIPFADSGGIRDFETNEDRGIWIEDRQRRWYYASFIGSCPRLDHAMAIGFDTRGSTNFDKFGAVVTGDDRCAIASLVTAEKPLPRKERLKLRKAAREDGRKAVAPKD
ncbi:MAG: hypothetical protein KA199_00885 [Sphingorhabdus sp.]|nr:hypothetical protein [Sphingorhabdus sp.]